MHVSEKEDNIIVFRQFNNVIEANIAKTKLDAYGVPCFLTDEHFVNLYPIQNEIFPGVRLCIFQKDEKHAHEVLKEDHLQATQEKIMQCPHCHSQNVKQEMKKNRFNIALLQALFLPPKTFYFCIDCEKNFQ